jgi:FKBP-type peptidyl-prolyl cis-trans isomerase 2
MTIKKGEFVEIEFTGFSEEGKVFDTNIEEVAKKNSMYNEEDKEKFKPLKICIGEGMLVKGFDKALEGKETEKEYKISLEPNEAFGIRNKDMIKTVSINSFKQQGFMPVAGMVVSLDNMLARIAAVSGGRVIIDFNNPLSGKKVNYEFKILKKINDDKEKIEMIINNSLGLPAEIEIIEGEKQKAK